MEQTLIIAKPDAVQRGLIGEIIARFERKGLKLLGIKMMSLDSALLSAHYSHLTDKPFYAGLEEFMKSSPVVVMAWEGFECVSSVRTLIGATNPREAQAGTVAKRPFRILAVTILTSFTYWTTNPVLVILTWLWALAGEGVEKKNRAYEDPLKSLL